MPPPDEGQSKILDTGLRECLDPEHLVSLALEAYRNLGIDGCDGGLMTERDRIKAYPPRYWDTQAPGWDEIVAMPTNPHQFYYLEADFLISSVLEKHMRVLELGCGTGGSTAVHHEEVARLVATDLSRVMLRGAAERFQDQPSVDLATVDAASLFPFETIPLTRSSAVVCSLATCRTLRLRSRKRTECYAVGGCSP
jgi:SAM-dependent methyltransferase